MYTEFCFVEIPIRNYFCSLSLSLYVNCLPIYIIFIIIHNNFDKAALHAVLFNCLKYIYTIIWVHYYTDTCLRSTTLQNVAPSRLPNVDRRGVSVRDIIILFSKQLQFPGSHRFIILFIIAFLHSLYTLSLTNHRLETPTPFKIIII